jgi:FkbM family methyltransferase
MSTSTSYSGAGQLLRRIIPRPLWARLRTARARRQLAAYPRRCVRHTYAGFPLEVVISDPVAADWYDHDVAEPAEVALLRSGRLASGARVFDLGAHQGVVALMLSRIVGAAGQVVAVEAVAHNASCAEENRQLNQAGNLVVLHAAAAEQPGTLQFEDGGGSHVASAGAEWTCTTVEAVSVDSLADRFGPPDVVYLDVEGYEQNVLAGAQQTLATARPDCFVEIHVGAGLEQFGGSIEGVLAHFPSEQYDLHARSADDHSEFRPVCGDALERTERFFLVALGRRAAE